MSSSLKNENTIIFFEEPCRVKGSGKSSGTKRKVAKKRKQTKKNFCRLFVCRFSSRIHFLRRMSQIRIFPTR